MDEVQSELQTLFDRQYTLTKTVTVEVRYRTETRTDSEGNEYDVEVPYNYYTACRHGIDIFFLVHMSHKRDAMRVAPFIHRFNIIL